MKITLQILIFITLAFDSFGQKRMFEQEEKAAIAFMESQFSQLYNNQFKIKFIGTVHEFEKIYGYQFLIIETKDRPITVVYNLIHKSPLFFDKTTFEEDYESMKIEIKDSEELENELIHYYPYAIVFSDRIKNSDEKYRWVKNIYTASSLNHDKERIFYELDSISILFTTKIKELDVIYNFYFPIEDDLNQKTENRISFFEFENFRNKYIYHYRIDLEKNGAKFKITNREFYDNLNEEQLGILKKKIEDWKKNNGFGEWELSMLTESSIKRNLEEKKFMLESQSGNKKFGFINFKTYALKLED